MYDTLGEYDQALDSFNQALVITVKIGDRTEGEIRKKVRLQEARTLNNIGTIYSNMGQPSQALDALYQSLSIREEVGDDLGTAITLNIWGKFMKKSDNQPKL